MKIPNKKERQLIFFPLILLILFIILLVINLWPESEDTINKREWQSVVTREFDSLTSNNIK